MVRQVPDPVLGEITITGFPFKFSEHPELLDLQAPLLGEHNRNILLEVLEYPSEKVDQLESDGVLQSSDI